jgi:hypothetical protein
MQEITAKQLLLALPKENILKIMEMLKEAQQDLMLCYSQGDTKYYYDMLIQLAKETL